MQEMRFRETNKLTIKNQSSYKNASFKSICNAFCLPKPSKKKLPVRYYLLRQMSEANERISKYHTSLNYPMRQWRGIIISNLICWQMIKILSMVFILKIIVTIFTRSKGWSRTMTVKAIFNFKNFCFTECQKMKMF